MKKDVSTPRKVLVKISPEPEKIWIGNTKQLLQHQRIASPKNSEVEKNRRKMCEKQWNLIEKIKEIWTVIKKWR